MFHNAGFPEYYIGSADWMARNLSHRVEAVVRVEDPACKAELEKIVRVYLDDERAWRMQPDGTYARSAWSDAETPRGAQEMQMAMHAALDVD